MKAQVKNFLLVGCFFTASQLFMSCQKINELAGNNIQTNSVTTALISYR
jgi:hypothetical protein